MSIAPLNYPIHRHRLANGLRLNLSPDPWTPVVAVNLWYDVGSAHERPGRQGFAHLFEHLMFSGSAQVAPGEHLGQLQALGGEVNATTSFDRTNYFETVPQGAAELALWFEAERLGGLLAAIDQATLDSEREVVKEEKRQRYDNLPYGEAFDQLVRLAFGPDHPYGHLPIGSMADLDAASLADVRAFFNTYYRPDNAVLSLAGAIDLDRAVGWAEDYFGDLSPATSQPAPPSAFQPAPQPTPGTLGLAVLPPLTGQPQTELVRDVPREAVYCAWRTPAATDPEHDAIDLVLSILADGLASRLHQALVRPGLAHAVAASGLGLARGNSLAVVQTTVQEGVEPAAVEQRLLAAWRDFLDQGPTAAELERAVAQAARDWLSALAHLETRADALSEASTTHDDPGRINTWLSQLSRLTAADLRRTANQWLDPGQ
ncbi:MAG: insulinase family protein, partial [Propionibacteriaceae bacterium]|nr:insulinase family protein [Propionibacteriaceae bacterium]